MTALIDDGVAGGIATLTLSRPEALHAPLPSPGWTTGFEP